MMQYPSEAKHVWYDHSTALDLPQSQEKQKERDIQKVPYQNAFIFI